MAGTREGFGLRKAFGMIECHTEGWAAGGRFSVKVAYVRQYWECEALTGRDKCNVMKWGDNLHTAVRRWQVKAVDIVAFMNMHLINDEFQAKSPSFPISSSGLGSATFPKA